MPRKAAPRKPSARRIFTCRGTLARYLWEEVERLKATAWPNEKWRDDPVGFVTEVLRESPLPHQADILRAIVTHEKVAVRSGQKNGKTKLVVWAALWWYMTRPAGRVIMTAAIGDQIKRVIWNELENTIGLARRAGVDIERPGKSPASGLVSTDGRQIIGFTARDVEAVAGISGPEMLFIVDEASALKQNFAEAIEGNMAGGGCRQVYISNPTRTEGPFFDAFHAKRAQFACFALDGEKIAAYVASLPVPIRGVVDLRKIEQWREEYGANSVFYKVRVKGEFVYNETGKIVSIAAITEAQQRDGDDTGDLTLGVDPAGPGDGGDETSFCVLRGHKMLQLVAFRSLTEDAIVAHARGLLQTWRRGDECPRIIVDAEGPIGSALVGKMRGIADVLRRTRPTEAYECYGVKASHDARREPQLYEKIRDELWASAAKWLEVGSIIPDHMLEAELHAPSFESTLSGKLKVTHKNRLRDILGRSPDRADSFCLATWNPTPWLQPGVQENTVTERVGLPEETGADMDPYAGPGIDPYATWGRH